MNVLIAADYRAPKSGNFISSIITLGIKLKSQGDNLVCVFPEYCDWYNWFKKKDLDVEIVPYDCHKHDISSFVQIVKKYRVDVVHIHFGMFLREVVQNRTKLGDVRIIMHDHMDFGMRHNIISQFCYCSILSAKYALKHIDIISVMKLKNDSYVFNHNKWYVPNGLSFDRYLDYNITREECRDSLGVKGNDILCLFMGWDYKRKGLDVAVMAVKESRKKNNNITLGIIGCGEGRPSEKVSAYIENTTDVSPYESWIRFFSSYEDIFAVHEAADVFISASRREAFSYALLESISKDTPLVVSDIPGTQWVRQYNNSFLFPADDYHACSEAILKAIEIGRTKTNSAEIINQYSIENWCDKIIKIYGH